MRLGRWERNFGYRCILTCAQIELMQSDLPHTLFLNDKKKKQGKNDDYKYNPDDPAIKKQMEAIRRKKEKMEADGEKVEYTMDELFNR